MDFKATIAAEIEAKKLAMQKAGGDRKSVKVADLERQKQEEYFANQKLLEEEREVANKCQGKKVLMLF
jgi:hypothetical protein